MKPNTQQTYNFAGVIFTREQWEAANINPPHWELDPPQLENFSSDQKYIAAMRDYADRVLVKKQAPPTYDLKTAAEEIKAILKRHNIAALITLVAPGKMEWVRELSPTWSCATIEDSLTRGPFLRFRAMLADFPNKEAQQEAIRLTLEMLLGFQHQAMQDYNAMEGIIAEAAKHMDISSRIEKIK